MKDDNIDDDDEHEDDNGIIGAAAAVATHNFPFVWHVKMFGISVMLQFGKDGKKRYQFLYHFNM